MCSRGWGAVRTFIVGGLLFFLSACSLSVGDRSNPTLDLKIKGLDQKCLKGWSTSLSSFLNGEEGSDTQIQQSVSCVSDALRLFTRYAKGTEEGRFSIRKDLKPFLEKYFLDKRTLGDQLLVEVEFLKEALISGEAASVSREDIDWLIEVLGVVSRFAPELRPVLPLEPSTTQHFSAEKLDQGVDVFQRFSEALGEKVPVLTRAYEFKKLGNLFRQLILFLGKNHKAAKQLKWVRDNLVQISPSIKGVLLGASKKDSLAIQSRDWKEFFLIGAQWYGFFLRLHHVYNYYPSMIHGEGLDRVVTLMTGDRLLDKKNDGETSRSLLGLLSQAVNRNPNASISFSKVKSMMDSLEEADFFPYCLIVERQVCLESTSVEKLIRHFFSRGFIRDPKDNSAWDVDENGVSNAEKWERHGVELVALRRLEGLFLRWAYGQKWIERAFVQGGVSFSQIRQVALEKGEALNKVGKVAEAEILKSISSQRKQKIAKKVIFGLKEMLRDPKTKAYFPPADNLMHFWDGKSPKMGFSFQGVSHRNWMSLAVELMAEVYNCAKPDEHPNGCVTVTEALKTGMARDSFDAYYRTFRQIGIELTFFDPYRTDTARKRFIEADIFTPHANGNQLADKNEVIELLMTLMSGKLMAVRLHNEIHKRLKAWVEKYPNDDEYELVDLLDTYRRPLIDRNFYKKEMAYTIEQMQEPWLKTHFPDVEAIWRGMPDLVLNYNRMNHVQKEQYFSNLEKATGISRVSGLSQLNSATTDSFIIFTHYVEVLFERFDKNRDGFLASTEVLSAYSVFRDLLQRIPQIKEKGEDEIDRNAKILFTYLLQYGVNPQSEGAPDLATLTPGKGWANKVTDFTWDFSEKKLKKHFNPAPRSRVFELIALLGEITR